MGVLQNECCWPSAGHIRMRLKEEENKMVEE